MFVDVIRLFNINSLPTYFSYSVTVKCSILIITQWEANGYNQNPYDGYLYMSILASPAILLNNKDRAK